MAAAGVQNGFVMPDESLRTRLRIKQDSCQEDTADLDKHHTRLHGK